MGGFVPWTPGRKNSPGWVVAESGCHLWIGARNPNGYGQVTYQKMRYLVHRLRYEREIGPVPDGLELDHFACDNGPRGCCNPHHCRPVTHRENVLRSNSMAARHAARTHCSKGHPLTGDNVYWCNRRDQHTRGRECRACKNATQRAYLGRVKAKTDHLNGSER